MRSKISYSLAEAMSDTSTPYTSLILATSASFVSSVWKSQRLDASEIQAQSSSRMRWMEIFRQISMWTNSFSRTKLYRDCGTGPRKSFLLASPFSFH
jgi:hypothetical protein